MLRTSWRRLGIGLLGALLAGLFITVRQSPHNIEITRAEASSPNMLPRPVFIHYYPWFSAPPFTSTYGHWDGGDASRPGLPANIISASYPALNPYASLDPAVLGQHMAWITEASTDVLIYSWWGQNSPEDQEVSAVMAAAGRAGLKVAFQIEPYSGRTIQSAISDIGYIYSQYGQDGAFYRASRPTLYGPSRSPRGMFFLYAPPSGGTFDAIRGTANDAIVVGRLDDSMIYTDGSIRKAISGLRLDGLYNYGQYTYSALAPISRDYIIVPGVSPGFDNTRNPATTHAYQVPRNQGAYYDSSWSGLAALKPEAVAVVSFNEWLETTQIEPAQPFSYNGYNYLDYEGHYGLTGASAAGAYLNRTAYWVTQYHA